VLLADDGRAELTDVGIAAVPGDAFVTRIGLLVGYAAYGPPSVLGEHRSASTPYASIKARRRPTTKRAQRASPSWMAKPVSADIVRNDHPHWIEIGRMCGKFVGSTNPSATAPGCGSCTYCTTARTRLAHPRGAPLRSTRLWPSRSFRATAAGSQPRDLPDHLRGAMSRRRDLERRIAA